VSQQPTAFQTAYRLTIMLGTLTVGSLAAYRYGPDAERLAESIDYVASIVGAAADDAATSLDTTGLHSMGPESAGPEIEPAPFTPDLAFSHQPAPPRYDAAVQPASGLTPIEQPAPAPPANSGSMSALDRERLTAPLLAAGATRADVMAWGRGPQTVYRASASASVSGDAAGLERRFDAIGSTPEEAVETLAAEIRSSSLR
jgi:hypothetical protein